MNSKVLVVGYGSIGQRHCEVLESMDCDVFKVSRRQQTDKSFYPSIEAALEHNEFSHIVIASETTNHLSSLQILDSLNYKNKVLVEKPIFNSIQDLPSLKNTNNIFVGYNMRFNPLLNRLRETLKEQQVISVSAYVGQYLPDWRPGTDYRKSYSASSKAGGGVLRDLSHELDYLLWLFGPIQHVKAMGGKLSKLEIESEDIISCLAKFDHCSIANITLNYLDRDVSRFLIVNTQQDTLKIDFIEKSFKHNGEEEKLDNDRNYAYREMHNAILNNPNDIRLCTYQEGIEVMQFIEKIEHALENKQ